MCGLRNKSSYIPACIPDMQVLKPDKFDSQVKLKGVWFCAGGGGGSVDARVSLWLVSARSPYLYTMSEISFI